MLAGQEFIVTGDLRSLPEECVLIIAGWDINTPNQFAVLNMTEHDDTKATFVAQVRHTFNNPPLYTMLATPYTPPRQLIPYTTR